MNRKYIRLRRFLGISTILLGLLIAIIPTFSRAATDIKAVIKENNWHQHGAGYISAVYHFAGDVDPNTGIYLVLQSGNDGPELETFKKLGLVEVGEKDRAVDLFIDEDGRSDSMGSFNVELTLPMPESFDEIPGNDIDVYRIEMGENKVKAFNDVAVETREGIQVVSVYTDAVSSRDSRGYYAFVFVKRYPENEPDEEQIVISSIDDQRTDKKDSKGISSLVYGGSIPKTILIVRDSDGVGIKSIVVMRKGMIMKPWYIRLVDENRKDVKDFKSVTITLPIPASMNLNKGRVVMVGKRANGKLHVFDTKIVTKNGLNCAEFTTDYFSDYEYGMLYTPDGAGADENTLIISDERDDKQGSEYISASVTEGSGQRTLHIEDSDGVIVRRRIVWKDGMKLKPYRIWMTDEEGNKVDDFGTLTVTLPLPEDMDPKKGSIRVVGSTKENATDDFVPEIIKNDDGTYSVRFSTDYFSDNEYGIVYTPSSLESDVAETPTPTKKPTSTPTPTPRATATPTLSPTPYANITPTPTPKTATPTPKTATPTSSGDAIVTVVVTSTPTPTPDNYGGGNGNPGRTPIVTPRGKMFYEDGVSKNYATTGSGSGGRTANYQGSGNNTKGSNAKDMPKTGMADVPRMILVIVLIALGSIQLISTIPLKKD